jgi:hypothetical protein
MKGDERGKNNAGMRNSRPVLASSPGSRKKNCKHIKDLTREIALHAL